MDSSAGPAYSACGFRLGESHTLRCATAKLQLGPVLPDKGALRFSTSDQPILQETSRAQSRPEDVATNDTSHRCDKTLLGTIAPTGQYTNSNGLCPSDLGIVDENEVLKADYSGPF